MTNLQPGTHQVPNSTCAECMILWYFPTASGRCDGSTGTAALAVSHCPRTCSWAANEFNGLSTTFKRRRFSSRICTSL